MERDSRYEVENVSTFKPCDGDARFRRLYVNVRRKEKKQSGKGVTGGVKKYADKLYELDDRNIVEVK